MQRLYVLKTAVKAGYGQDVLTNQIDEIRAILATINKA